MVRRVSLHSPIYVHGYNRSVPHQVSPSLTYMTIVETPSLMYIVITEVSPTWCIPLSCNNYNRSVISYVHDYNRSVPSHVQDYLSQKCPLCHVYNYNRSVPSLMYIAIKSVPPPPFPCSKSKWFCFLLIKLVHECQLYF